MGASESSEQKEQWTFKDLAASDIQQIKQFTKGSLTSKEIHLFHYAFMHKMKIVPKHGKITRDMFILFFREMGEEWLTEKLLCRIDKDNQGIDFKEFLNWFYLLSRGTIEERRKLIFSLYDLDNKRVIRRNDVKKFVAALAWRIKLSCLDSDSPLDTSDDTPSVRRRLLQSDEENEKEKNLLHFHIKLPHLGHENKDKEEEKEVKEEKKKKKLGKKFEEFKETIEDMITRKEIELETKVDNLRLALDDPRIKKKLGILYQMVDDFFENTEVLTFQEYEEKYFVNVGSAVFTGFGILDYCYHKLFEPMESTIMEDIVSPPTREGYLLKRRAGLATSMDLMGNFDKRYFRLEQGFLFVFENKPNEKKDKPQKVIPLLNTSISVKSAFDQRDECTFYIRTVLPTGETWSRYLKTRDEGEKFDWAYDIICNVQEIPENRYHSYAPPRDYVAARWFVDGKDTFSFICDCLRMAKKEIFITDWWLNPEVYLKRDYNSNDFGLETRLDILLKKKAEEGVAIYNETKIALELNSLYTKNKLEKLHRNITVLRHPDNWPLYWAHHQKSVIVDQDLAFVGGLDLCYGRWDSPDHNITDTCQLRTQWPGKDYSNESIKVTTGIDRPFDDAFDRMVTPRMGWHDVHCCVDGQAARDIAYNFIQRWNHHVIGTSTAHLFPKTFPPRLFLDENGSPAILNMVTSSSQVLPTDENTEEIKELRTSDSMPTISVTGLDAPQVSEMGLIGVPPPSQEIMKSRSNSLTNSKKAPVISPTSSPTLKTATPSHRRSKSVDTHSWSGPSKNSSLDLPSSRGSRGPSPGNTLSRARAESVGVSPSAPPCFSPMCRVQVCRSLSLWSGGLFTETSIYQAYIDLIATAEHYIYIENQFFISSLAGNGVQNRIGEAILHRIRKAIISNQVFRVIIVLPCFPTGGSWKESASIQYVMKWQYATINRGGHSLIEQIQQEFPKVNPEDYIVFCSLRNHGEILGNPVTELIYVHSKLMIVDDRIAVIGSANINDRSMLGDRDSEIGVIIEDGQRVDTKMNGQHYKGRRFAHELRMSLFREHLGVYNNDNALLDPTIESFYKGVWVKIAKWNTQLYCELFHDIPNDSIESFAELMRRDSILKAWLEDPVRKAQTLDFLRGIQGHLTMFPYQFLKEESFSSAAIESWLSEEIFQ